MTHAAVLSLLLLSDLAVADDAKTIVAGNAQADEVVVGLAAALRQPETVRHLDVPTSETPADALDAIAGFPNLRTLILAGDAWYEFDDLRRLARVASLESLVLDSTGFAPVRLDWLAERRPDLTVIRSQKTALASLRRYRGVGSPSGRTEIPDSRQPLADLIGKTHFERAVEYVQRYSTDEYALADGPLPASAIADVAKLWTLQRFEAHCFEMDDAALLQLSELQQLRRFSFPDGELPALTDAGFAVFRDLPELEMVAQAPLNDVRLGCLSAASSLKSVHGFCVGPVTKAGLDYLAGAPGLTHLGLHNVDFDGPELAVLSRLDALQTLLLRGRIDDLAALQDHPALVQLVVLNGDSDKPSERLGLTDQQIGQIATCRSLRRLSVRIRPDAQDAIESLATLPQLAALLVEVPLGPDQTAPLGQIASREAPSVDIHGSATPPSAAELRYLLKMKNLKTLSFSGLRLDEDVRNALAELPPLKQLYLAGQLPMKPTDPRFVRWTDAMDARHTRFRIDITAIEP